MEEKELNTSNEEAQKKQLNIETVKELWSKTYNTEGKPDWSHIFKYYHKDIVFQDTIQRIEGIDNFIDMCNRLTKRTKQLNMEIVSIVQNDNTINRNKLQGKYFRRNLNRKQTGCYKL